MWRLRSVYRAAVMDHLIRDSAPMELYAWLDTGLLTTILRPRDSDLEQGLNLAWPDITLSLQAPPCWAARSVRPAALVSRAA